MSDVTSALHENVMTLTKGFSAFPEDVFVQNQPWVRQYLLPLLSIDLGVVRPDLAGTVVHMLNPT